MTLVLRKYNNGLKVNIGMSILNRGNRFQLLWLVRLLPSDHCLTARETYLYLSPFLIAWVDFIPSTPVRHHSILTTGGYIQKK